MFFFLIIVQLHRHLNTSTKLRQWWQETATCPVFAGAFHAEDRLSLSKKTIGYSEIHKDLMKYAELNIEQLIFLTAPQPQTAIVQSTESRVGFEQTPSQKLRRA